MHQPESSILPDVFDSSAISEYRNMKHLFASSFQRMSNMDDGVRTQDPPINGHTNHTFVQHHVNPGSYIAEDRAYFEQIQDEELAQKDIKIVECQEEIRHLQKQLQRSKEACPSDGKHQ